MAIILLNDADREIAATDPHGTLGIEDERSCVVRDVVLVVELAAKNECVVVGQLVVRCRPIGLSDVHDVIDGVSLLNLEDEEIIHQIRHDVKHHAACPSKDGRSQLPVVPVDSRHREKVGGSVGRGRGAMAREIRPELASLVARLGVVREADAGDVHPSAVAHNHAQVIAVFCVICAPALDRTERPIPDGERAAGPREAADKVFGVIATCR